MKKSVVLFMMCAAILPAHAIVFPSGGTGTMSKDGLIQNVQNYSSAPYWNPNGPYNQRMPSPVYVQGTELDAGDCTAVVNALVASVCAARNNCVNDQLSDVRPTIMVQLSRMPGHNYASSCAGYVDTAFADYVAQYAFPTAVAPNANAQQNTQGTGYQIPNPLAPKLPIAPNGEPWMQDMLDRKQELKDLQAQNGAGVNARLAAADFPTTIADVSFTDRIANATAGYAPYKDAKAYHFFQIESDQKAASRQNTRQSMCQGTYRDRLAKLDSDLKKIKACRAAQKPWGDCAAGLEGSYL
ncbi:hypothetical protein HDR63_04015 [bacterium]|nr:hypothetical protein [bacterium]